MTERDYEQDKSWRCDVGQSVYLGSDGKVAVCMKSAVAEFTMCATAIGSGETQATDSSETTGSVGGPEEISAEFATKEQRIPLVRETASADIQSARAEALRACRMILESAYARSDKTSPMAPAAASAAAPSSTPNP